MKVTVKGLDRILSKLDRVSNIDAPIQEALLEIMTEAEVIVKTKYSLQSNGNTDFATRIESIENGVMLTIYGEDIGFLEFGAGVFTEADEFASVVDYPVHPGSWSETHVHRGEGNPNVRYFAKNGFWWWSNIRYTGLVPTRGAQTALDHIRNNIDELIARKIKKWIEQ